MISTLDLSSRFVLPHSVQVEPTQARFNKLAVRNPSSTEKSVTRFTKQPTASRTRAYLDLSQAMDETRSRSFNALTKPLDEKYPDWLAWSALAGICLLVAAIGSGIYAALIAHSTEWALVSACALLAGAVIWQFVLAKAEKLEDR